MVAVIAIRANGFNVHVSFEFTIERIVKFFDVNAFNEIKGNFLWIIIMNKYIYIRVF